MVYLTLSERYSLESTGEDEGLSIMDQSFNISKKMTIPHPGCAENSFSIYGYTESSVYCIIWAGIS